MAVSGNNEVRDKRASVTTPRIRGMFGRTTEKQLLNGVILKINVYNTFTEKAPYN